MKTRKRAHESDEHDEAQGKTTKKPRTKEQCVACGEERVLLLHLSKSSKCREQYPDFENMKKGARKATNSAYYAGNSVRLREVFKQNYQKNHSKIRLSQRIYRMTNRQALNEKKRQQRYLKRCSMTSEERIKRFKQSIQGGLNYICESCDRQFFRDSVRILTEKQISELKAKCGTSFLKTVLPTINFRLKFPTVVLCHNCNSKIKSKKCPSINISNGFALEDVPEELKLKDLEQQLIAKVLLFMKVLPMTKKHKMPKIIDRVINVPLHDEDITKTISSLPRSPNDAAILDVMFKRKLDLKSPHNHAYIKRSVLIKALKKLKELKNPFYINVKIDEDNLDEELDAELDAISLEESDGAELEDDLPDESDVDRGGFGTNAKTLTDADTCLVPTNLESDVIVAGDDTDAAKSIELAPGI